MADDLSIGTLTAETEAASSPAEVETPSTETEVSTETTEPQLESAQDTSTEEEAAPETEIEGEEAQAEDEEAELAEWRGSGIARLREMCKQAPGLDKLLAQFPKVRDSIVASFKRDAALRDRNITIAEIDGYRSRCVNGLQDLEAMERSVQEAVELDNAFFTKDRDGNYPGHQNFIDNLFQQDKNATIALLRTVPKEWARVDPDGYNETFGAIMAATFREAGVKDTIADVHNALKEHPELQKELARVYNYLDGFGKKPGKSADPETERLRREITQRDQRDRERAETDGQAFHQSLIAEAVKNHRAIVSGHDLIKKLPQTIHKEKRAEIIDKVCRLVEGHLAKSFSFKRDIEDAYVSRNPGKWHEVDKKGWQPWLVNYYVRHVLNVETPGILQGNKAANAVKKAAAARTGLATRAQQKPSATPTKEKFKLTDYTTAEILSGFHDRQLPPGYRG